MVCFWYDVKSERRIKTQIKTEELACSRKFDSAESQNSKEFKVSRNILIFLSLIKKKKIKKVLGKKIIQRKTGSEINQKINFFVFN